MKGREVHLLGAAAADVDHVDARIGQPLAHSRREVGTGQTDVVADRDGAGLQPLSVRARDRDHELAVQLGRNATPDVVRLEAGQIREISHGIVS